MRRSSTSASRTDGTSSTSRAGASTSAAAPRRRARRRSGCRRATAKQDARRISEMATAEKQGHRVDWREWFDSRQMTPEQAVAAVKSGDRVGFTYGREPIELGMALVARAGELENVT